MRSRGLLSKECSCAAVRCMPALYGRPLALPLITPLHPLKGAWVLPCRCDSDGHCPASLPCTGGLPQRAPRLPSDPPDPPAQGAAGRGGVRQRCWGIHGMPEGVLCSGGAYAASLLPASQVQAQVQATQPHVRLAVTAHQNPGRPAPPSAAAAARDCARVLRQPVRAHLVVLGAVALPGGPQHGGWGLRAAMQRSSFA